MSTGAPGPPGREPDPRFTLANERTFLAWNRTALALLAVGLAAVQFLDFGYRSGRYLVALPLIGLGGWVGAASLRRWRGVEDAIRHGQPLPLTRLPLLLAGGIWLVALVGAAVVVADLVR